MSCDRETCVGDLLTRRGLLRAGLAGAGVWMTGGLLNDSCALAAGGGKVTFRRLEGKMPGKGKGCQHCIRLLNNLTGPHLKSMEALFPEGAEITLAIGRSLKKTPDNTIAIGVCTKNLRNSTELFVDGCAGKFKNPKSVIADIEKAAKAYKGGNTSGRSASLFKEVEAPAKETASKPSTPRKRTRPLTRTEKARVKFLSLYRGALDKDLDFKKAMKYGELLAGDKRYPSLNSFGRSCYTDARDLALVSGAVSGQLKKIGSGEEQSFSTRDDKTVTGHIAGVEDNAVRLKSSGGGTTLLRFADMASADLVRLFRSGYPRKTPSPEMILGILHFARGEREAAESLFEEISRKDPRRKHHSLLLEYID